MRTLAESILDTHLNGYPWMHWSKENAINAMVEFAKEFHKAQSAIEKNGPDEKDLFRRRNEVSYTGIVKYKDLNNE